MGKECSSWNVCHCCVGQKKDVLASSSGLKICTASKSMGEPLSRHEKEQINKMLLDVSVKVQELYNKRTRLSKDEWVRVVLSSSCVVEIVDPNLDTCSVSIDSRDTTKKRKNAIVKREKSTGGETTSSEDPTEDYGDKESILDELEQKERDMDMERWHKWCTICDMELSFEEKNVEKFKCVYCEEMWCRACDHIKLWDTKKQKLCPKCLKSTTKNGKQTISGNRPSLDGLSDMMTYSQESISSVVKKELKNVCSEGRRPFKEPSMRQVMFPRPMSDVGRLSLVNYENKQTLSSGKKRKVRNSGTWARKFCCSSKDKRFKYKNAGDRHVCGRVTWKSTIFEVLKHVKQKHGCEHIEWDKEGHQFICRIENCDTVITNQYNEGACSGQDKIAQANEKALYEDKWSIDIMLHMRHVHDIRCIFCKSEKSNMDNTIHTHNMSPNGYYLGYQESDATTIYNELQDNILDTRSDIMYNMRREQVRPISTSPIERIPPNETLSITQSQEYMDMRGPIPSPSDTTKTQLDGLSRSEKYQVDLIDDFADF